MKLAIRDAARVIRSKNAGPYELTMDIIIRDEDVYRRMQQSDAINAALIARLYHVPEKDVLSVVWFPNALAVKATIVRPLPSGAIGERDVYGAQQHAPLMDLVIELPE